MLLLAKICQAEDAPAPSGCRWQEIPEIKATLAVPVGWRFRKLPPEKQVLVYEVVPAGAGVPKNSRSRYELRVERGLPHDAVTARARSHVEDVLTGGTDPTGLEEQSHGDMTLFAGVAHSAPDAAGVPQVTTAVEAIANSRTGTLYTVRFVIPASELEQVMPLGNLLFRTIQVDDEV